MTISIILYHIINKEYDIPKTIFGKRLSIGNSKENKRSRRDYYIKEALILSTIFLIFDIINPDRLTFSISFINWKYMPYILEYFIRFILFLFINFVWGEFNVKKQRKFNDSLDNANIEDID